MANYQIKKGAASDAAATLSTLAASNPDLHLTTAILYYQLGNAAAADKQAEQQNVTIPAASPRTLAM